MLGEQYAELKGKITGQRVLDIDCLQQLKLNLSIPKALTKSRSLSPIYIGLLNSLWIQLYSILKI